MCGRYALTTPADVLAKLLEATAGALVVAGAERWPARYNLAPTQLAPVVRRGPEEDERRLDVMRWGLVPSWADDPKIGSRMINARSETVATRPAFREAFVRRRCLVPADGFFEWQKVGDAKQPYFIHAADESPLVFAGLWERWRREEETVESFTILTTEANASMRSLHDRMPAILSPAAWPAWLDTGQSDASTLGSMLAPASANPASKTSRAHFAGCTSTATCGYPAHRTGRGS
jgi:putative SOS response-associated peptidase YedK